MRRSKISSWAGIALVLTCGCAGDSGGSDSGASPGGREPLRGVNVACTFLGGAHNDRVQGVSLMPDGRVLIAGETLSRFDLASAQSPWSQVPPTSHHEWANGAASSIDTEAFVAILSSDLSRIEQWAYIGGCHGDRAYYAQADAQSIYVVGVTKSLGPCSPASFPADQIYGQSGQGADFDVFVARFNLALDVRERLIVFAGSTLGEESARGSMSLVTDASGIASAVYLSGTTVSSNFPVAALTNIANNGQLDHTWSGPSDAFVVRLDRMLAPQWACFYGGTGSEYAAANVRYHAGLDAVFIGGVTSSDDLEFVGLPFDDTLNGSTDGFVARFDASTGALQAATYLGGGEGDSVGYNDDLELTPAGDVVVAGMTRSLDFPVTSNAPQSAHSSVGGESDLFVTVFEPSLSSAPLFSTFLGGSETEEASGLAVSAAGHIYLTGETSSDDFPMLAPRAFDALYTTCFGTHAGGYADCFLVELVPTASANTALAYATYFCGDVSVATPTSSPNDPPHGARGRSLLFDESNDTLLYCGQTTTDDFPVTTNAVFRTFAGEEEGFVARHKP